MANAKTLIHERVEAADRGENPTVICRMKSGYLVMCDKQTPRGWCILIAVPIVHDLDDLDDAARADFLADMARAGAAIKRVTGAYRMNYSILGNTDPALHAHLQPRFADEPDDLRRQPLWAIWNKLPDVAFDVVCDTAFMKRLSAEFTPMPA